MKKELYLTEGLTKEYAETFLKQLRPLNPSEISELIIFIDSDGETLNENSISTIFSIFSELEYFKEKLTTVACFNCKGIASRIFFMGSKRYIFDKCNFWMDRPKYLPTEITALTSKKLSYSLNSLKNLENHIIYLLKENNIPEKHIDTFTHIDYDFNISVDALLKEHMVDTVIDFSFDKLA